MTVRTIILLLGLLWLLTPPAAAQLRGSIGAFSSDAAPVEDLREAGGLGALQQSTAASFSAPSAGKLLKRTGIGTLVGVGAGAAFGGVYLATYDHSNHEDDLILVGSSMLIGAMTGAVLGLVSAFFD
jgi:hypothetical protein